MKNILSFFSENLEQFFTYTAFANFTIGHIFMILVGLVFIYLAIAKEFEPLLLVPIGFGILVGNVPFYPGLEVGIYEHESVLNYLHFGVLRGVYPPLIFLGIGAMTDFSALISNPKLILVGAAAQLGIFGAYALALALGLSPRPRRPSQKSSSSSSVAFVRSAASIPKSSAANE
jgi:oxaloacetate decarboxylase beta subunit